MVLCGGDADRRGSFFEERPGGENAGPQHRDDASRNGGPARDIALVDLISYREFHARGIDFFRENTFAQALIQVVVGHRYASFANGAKLFRNSPRARLNRDITV